MDLKLKRTPGIYLAGFMGSGKTTVGRALADKLGWDFVDIDAEVETAAHMTIREIFASKGEPEFRRLETEMIRSLTKKVERGRPVVVALGGGAFVQPGNFEILQPKGISIWIDCPFEKLELRIAADAANRPLARDHESLRRLYDARLPGYLKADHRVDGDREVSEVVDSILHLPIWK
ncbi:MAG TPA: shikimate kinase [Bryobacteraceae bacterium]|nr:shikimate kinase [Bryobacteraceae bacterium]